MYPATITRKGQVTIPAAIRHYFNIKPSEKLLFSVDNKKIIAELIKGDIMDLYGSIKIKDKKPPDMKKIRRYAIKRIAENAASEGLK